jgi:hypothetical protein
VIGLRCKNSSANTFITSQDGEWEDSVTWNNHQLRDTVFNDTIIVKHNIHFNNHLLLTDVFMLLDSAGSLCGHYAIHLVNSQFYQYGDMYIDTLQVQSSQWNCTYGFFQVKYYTIYWGAGGHSEICCGCHGFGGGDFDCTTPPQTTLYPDTSHATLSFIRVYPNPFMDHFTIESEFPEDYPIIELDVYDLLGRKMKTIAIQPGKFTASIFTTTWPAGFYLLRFTEGMSILREMKLVMVK